MGGASTARRHQPIKLVKEETEETGKYGDPIGPTLVGIRTEANLLRTRLHVWTLLHASRGKAGEDTRSTAQPRPARPHPAAAPLEFCQ